jgi:hypothetical protein
VDDGSPIKISKKEIIMSDDTTKQLSIEDQYLIKNAKLTFQNQELVFRNFVLNMYIKYGLSPTDQIAEDGTVHSV